MDIGIVPNALEVYCFNVKYQFRKNNLIKYPKTRIFYNLILFNFIKKINYEKDKPLFKHHDYYVRIIQ